MLIIFDWPVRRKARHRYCFSSISINFCSVSSVEASLRDAVFHGILPGCIAQSVGHLTRKSGVLGSIPGLATYFSFSFRFFKKGSCQVLAKVCARSTG